MIPDVILEFILFGSVIDLGERGRVCIDSFCCSVSPPLYPTTHHWKSCVFVSLRSSESACIPAATSAGVLESEQAAGQHPGRKVHPSRGQSSSQF